MQDNKSVIILQKRCPHSTRKGSEHMHARHFFAVDKLAKKELKVVHCPTDKLVADHHGEPLQGKPFVNLRNEIMGVKEIEFTMHKQKYQSVLEKHGPFNEEEEDPTSLQTTGVCW